MLRFIHYLAGASSWQEQLEIRCSSDRFGSRQGCHHHHQHRRALPIPDNMIRFTFFLRQVTLRPQRGPTFWDQLLWDQLLFHRRLSIITSRMSCTYDKPGRGAKDTPTIWSQLGRYPEQGRPKNRFALSICSPVLDTETPEQEHPKNSLAPSVTHLFYFSIIHCSSALFLLSFHLMPSVQPLVQRLSMVFDVSF